MLHWFGPGYPLDYIYNFINLLIVITFITFFCVRYEIKRIFFILLIVTAITPLLINGPLMDWWRLPDQSKYLKDAINLRSFNFDSSYVTFRLSTGLDGRISILIPSIIFSLTPIFIENFNSLGFINRLLFSLFVIFLIKKKTSEIFIYYLILSPTILLYSSTGLKETLLIILMTLAFYSLRERKYLFFFIPFSILFFIKTQNALIIFPMYFAYLYFFELKFNYQKIITLFLIISTIFLVFFFQTEIINAINYHRVNFYEEDGGAFFLKIFENYFDILFTIPFEATRFIISPFPSVTSPIKFLMFVENVMIIFVFTYYFSKLNDISKTHFWFWFLSFFVFLSMYSIIVFNHGTISRYKSSFFIAYLFIIISQSEKLSNQLKNNEK
jgi:hypothetical protein